MTTAFILSPLGSNSNAFAQGGANNAAQGIAQGNNAAQNALCLSGALTGPACSNTSLKAT